MDGAALTLKDSAGGGQITGSTKTVFDVVNGGTVHMKGGQIDHCTSAIASVQKGTFDMTGGTITANTIKKGRLIDIQNGSFQISGSPVIEGNIAGIGWDYQLEAGETNRIIHVTGPLSADARIGIYSDPTENVVITSGLSGHGTAENFFSNVNGKTISLNEKGEAVWMDAPAFRTYSLLPSEENVMNVYLELPEINGVDYTDSYMEFRVKDPEKKTVTRALYDPEKRDAGGNGWYGFTCYADFPRVDGSITAVFHYGEGMTVEKTYSVRDIFFPDMFILSFDANGGRGEMASVYAKRSASYTLPECGFTAPGKVFVGWLVNKRDFRGIKQPGDVITVTEDMTIQARWESAVTIRFDANGGSGEMASVDIAQSASYTLPECGFTAAKGMRFVGWQVDQDAENIRQPGDVITVNDDLTITAIWKHVHDGQTFSPWNESYELPVSDYWSTLDSTERNYYLTKDVVLFKDWKPYVDVNLCLNGHTITIAGGSGIVVDHVAVNIYDCDEEGGGCIQAGGSNGKCVTVRNSGTLTLYGGSILSGGSDNVVITYNGHFVLKDGVVQSTAGRTVDLTSGTFRMEGGTIEGGSIVQSSGTFEMSGGTIDGSQVESSGGYFEMRGGAIEHATVNVWDGMFMFMSGGAIEHATVNVWGDMRIRGGSISGAAKDYAVNVYDRARFGMFGGEITGNTGGGVHVASKAEVFLDQCEVTGNTKDGKPCNIYLEKDAILSLQYYDRSDTPAKYGISTAVAPTKEKPVAITSGLKRNFTLRELFLPDDESYSVRVSQYGEPELELCVPPTVTFDANGGRGSMASAKANGGTWGDEYTLPECGFDAPFGTKFAGWQEERDTFVMQPGDVINISEDVTFKAIWEKVAISTPTISPTPSNPSVTGGQSSSGGSGSGGLRPVSNRIIDSSDGGQTSDDQTPVLFGKALASVNEITSRENGLDSITKARYGEEEDKPAGELYVLDKEVPLEKDVTLDEDLLKKYLIWTNVQTQHDMYLLPNTTRLYRGTRLDYVSEVIHGDVSGDGGDYDIDIITALNSNAFRHPVIPIGSDGSLDFSTGIFTLPGLADFELYLHEVSGKWMLELFDEGFLRRLDADQDAINEYTQPDSEGEVEAQAESNTQAERNTQTATLPQGEIVEGVTADGETDGRKKYWLGSTPENAADDAQTLVYLLVNEETDEIDAFRTSRRMIAAGDEDVDVSLYLYRDSKSDRMGEEKYNVMFFDTPEGEKSLVKVITDVLEERELEIPKTLKIPLRGFEIGGADYPVYSLTDHFLAMNDGTDGEVSMFDGFYTATIDGDTFESNYTRIETIPDQDSDSVSDQDSTRIQDDGLDGDLNVTVKKDQSIWPEWTSEDTASVPTVYIP